MSLVRGRDFSVLLQKVKNKIQNDLTDHLSASQSVNEGISINFKQSKQCFNALKCLKIVFSKWLKIAPPPPERAAAVDDLSKLVFRSINALKCPKIVKIYYDRSIVVFKQSNQCFNVLKCPKIVKSYYDRSFMVFKQSNQPNQCFNALKCPKSYIYLFMSLLQ